MTFLQYTLIYLLIGLAVSAYFVWESGTEEAKEEDRKFAEECRREHLWSDGVALSTEAYLKLFYWVYFTLTGLFWPFAVVIEIYSLISWKIRSR